MIPINLKIINKKSKKIQLIMNFSSKVILMTFLLFISCNDKKTNSDSKINIESNDQTEISLYEIDQKFPHHEMLDNPENLKGKTLTGVFILDELLDPVSHDEFSDPISLEIGLKDFMKKSNDGVFCKFYTYFSLILNKINNINVLISACTIFIV